MADSQKNPFHEPPNNDSAAAAFVREMASAKLIAGAAASVVSGLLTQQVKPDATVPTWIFLVVAISLFTLLVISIASLNRAVDAKNGALASIRAVQPRRVVVRCSAPYPPWKDVACVVIVEWSGPAAVVGGAVLLSIVENSIEKPLGFGTIRHIQEDKNIVITLDRAHDGVEKHILEICDIARSQNISKDLRVAETVMSDHFSNEMNRKKRPSDHAEGAEL